MKSHRKTDAYGNLTTCVRSAGFSPWHEQRMRLRSKLQAGCHRDFPNLTHRGNYNQL